MKRRRKVVSRKQKQIVNTTHINFKGLITSEDQKVTVLFWLISD